jgi:hypothetical protein
MSPVLALIAIAAMLVTGCDLVGVARPSGGPYPDACAELGFAARRCAAIVESARNESGIDKSAIAAVDILSRPREGSLQMGGEIVARVQFHLADGTSVMREAWCVGAGSPDNRACANDPQLVVSGGVDHDVTCPGAAPDPASCASLPPTPPQAAIAAAQPLHVAALDIPLDHAGKYAVRVGRASLPNGYLSRREFELADTRPTTFWITGGIRLDVRPTVAGRPPVGNIHRDAFKGSEPVEVFLVFEVTETSPGAILQVRDLVVQ